MVPPPHEWEFYSGQFEIANRAIGQCFHNSLYIEKLKNQYRWGYLEINLPKDIGFTWQLQ